MDWVLGRPPTSQALSLSSPAATLGRCTPKSTPIRRSAFHALVPTSEMGSDTQSLPVDTPHDGRHLCRRPRPGPFCPFRKCDFLAPPSPSLTLNGLRRCLRTRYSQEILLTNTWPVKPAKPSAPASLDGPPLHRQPATLPVVPQHPHS